MTAVHVDVSALSNAELELLGCGCGKLPPEQLAAFLTGVTKAGTQKSQHLSERFSPEMLAVKLRLVACVEVLEAMARGDIAQGHKHTQMA